MTSTDEYVIVGKIGATYGIKGWLKIQSFTETMLGIVEFNPWYIERGNEWQAIDIEDGRQHGNTVIVKLKGLNNPEQARLLTGKKIAVKQSQLPALKKDEYYWRDLEGLTVKNQRGEVLGTIAYLLATGANDVIVIKGDKEYGIPYLPGKVVKSIDLVSRIMTVDWELI